MKKLTDIFFLISLFALISAPLFTQDAKTEKKKNINDSKVTKKDSKKVVSNKTVDINKKKISPIVGSNKIAQNVSVTDKLLHIQDESFKLKRIPGYKIGNKNSTQDNIVKIPEGNDKTVSDKKKKGIFGLSEEWSDRLVKGSFIFLLFLIFIIYRLRSKKSKRKSVLRSIPK